jgi:hypothetical protein
MRREFPEFHRGNQNAAAVLFPARLFPTVHMHFE